MKKRKLKAQKKLILVLVLNEVIMSNERSGCREEKTEGYFFEVIGNGRFEGIG